MLYVSVRMFFPNFPPKTYTMKVHHDKILRTYKMEGLVQIMGNTKHQELKKVKPKSNNI